MLHSSPRKAKKMDSNKIQHPPNYVKCKTNKKNVGMVSVFEKKQSVLSFPSWSLKEMIGDTRRADFPFFIQLELLK